ncbi:hypothetical protein H112_08523 [Trichophyton rubrum D6]|uniref:Uncharacterized protein n=3 Tax=Trichophyton TaxID=5550 RepID=F2SEY6_TRIRC|nr:uncharacterized protein TERG_01082 [Trichophyton rubrum CBS 118892]EZF10158.1 hypothetical protein H100_08546 [Trichophyton rubrum MR850]EZF37019.1 hypothetical protein H102_08505 [Trichophyton rubrum CBS 100081]EZF47794.1 hypothetical protein H103_08527 [Trichophyton rubrum CBS 288.86]EZF58311.1 hypothetical protein H104_08479 [Trichophyton rubrum CBS 289.86]EZF68990.1 hypothetical protein H105_08533 [Trichophyton soudanense CBS 452.61]EZF79597.1 hypothetical protein H110_08529 [Trichophy
MAHREDFKEPTRSAAALESPLRSPLRRMSESHDNPFGLLAFAQLVTEDWDPAIIIIKHMQKQVLAEKYRKYIMHIFNLSEQIWVQPPTPTS